MFTVSGKVHVRLCVIFLRGLSLGSIISPSSVLSRNVAVVIRVFKLVGDVSFVKFVWVFKVCILTRFSILCRLLLN